MMTRRNYGKLDEQVPEIVFALGADRQGKPTITMMTIYIYVCAHLQKTGEVFSHTREFEKTGCGAWPRGRGARGEGAKVI